MIQLAFYINKEKVDRTILSKLIYNLQKLKLMLFTKIKLCIYASYAVQCKLTQAADVRQPSTMEL